jgi:MtN3 and saliva related transmembrane protein
MNYIDLIGFVAGAIGIITFVPQARRAWSTLSTKDLSASSYMMLSLGAVLWTLYGVLKQELPIILPNIVTLVLLLTILAAKLRFK